MDVYPIRVLPIIRCNVMYEIFAHYRNLWKLADNFGSTLMTLGSVINELRRRVLMKNTGQFVFSQPITIAFVKQYLIRMLGN